MAAKIDSIIPLQGIDIIGPRIVSILGEELANQATLQTNPALGVTVWSERLWKFNTNETPVANVQLQRGDNSNRDQKGTTAEYVYLIDVWSRAASTNANDADKTGAAFMLRLLGLARGILENPKYRTLDFTPAFVQRTYVRSVQVAQTGDMENVETLMQGRIEFVVVCTETNNLATADTIANWETTVKLAQTDKGYYWQGSDLQDSETSS